MGVCVDFLMLACLVGFSFSCWTRMLVIGVQIEVESA